MPSRANVENAAPRLGRQVDITAAGVPLWLISQFNGDTSIQDDTMDFFGQDSQMYWRSVEAGTLTLTSSFAREAQPLIDILTDQAPSTTDTATRLYYPNTGVSMDVVKMYKKPDASGYDAVEYFGRWRPVYKPPTGGPKERRAISIDGRCEPPLYVVAKPGEYIAIVSDVVQLVGGTGNLSTVANLTRTMVPTAMRGFKAAGMYALSVEVQKRGSGGSGAISSAISSYVRVPVTASMVTSGGLVTITASDLNGTGMAYADITCAFVTYLVTATSANPTGLIYETGKALASFKSRFD